jgi:hypothetical protein
MKKRKRWRVRDLLRRGSTGYDIYANKKQDKDMQKTKKNKNEERIRKEI